MAASTGSPASRRSTKLTPLTTRPSLTSRQGMTRTLNDISGYPRCLEQLDRLGRIEPPVVKRTSRDRAFELARIGFRHTADIRDRREAAGGNHRNRDRVGERDRRLP